MGNKNAAQKPAADKKPGKPAVEEKVAEQAVKAPPKPATEPTSPTSTPSEQAAAAEDSAAATQQTTCSVRTVGVPGGRRYRAGLVFHAEPTVVDTDMLSVAQLVAIAGDPHLVIGKP